MRRWAAFWAQLRSGFLPYLFLIGAAAYTILAITSFGGTVVALCGRVSVQAAWGYLSAMPWSLGFGPLATDWGLMIIAMMTPLVSVQIARIIWCSRPNPCAIAIIAFLFAYWLVWIATSVFLIPLAFALTSALGSGLTSVVTIAMALIYSSSPAAQRARNRCHKTNPVPAFGFGILTKSAQSGMATGTNCAAVCWPWMLVPITIQSYHLLAMMFVGIFLFFDRIAPAAQPLWRLAPGLETVLGFYRPLSKLQRALHLRGNVLLRTKNN